MRENTFKNESNVIVVNFGEHSDKYYIKKLIESKNKMKSEEMLNEEELKVFYETVNELSKFLQTEISTGDWNDLLLHIIKVRWCDTAQEVRDIYQKVNFH